MTIYKNTLTHKLVLLLFLITSGPIFCIGTWSYWSGSKALEKQFLSSFQWLVTAKAQAVKGHLQEEMTRVEDFSSDAGIRQLLVKYTAGEVSKVELSQKLNELLFAKIALTSADSEHGHYETLVIDPKGQVLGSTRPELFQSHQFSEVFLARALKQPSLDDVYKHPSTGEIGFLVAAPIRQNKGGSVLGILINRIGTKELNATMLKGITKFGETGEFYLVNKNNLRITESRFEKGVILQQEINTEPVRVFHEKQQAYVGSYLDYRNIRVLGVSEAQILAEADNLGWLLIAEMKNSETNMFAAKLSAEIAAFGVVAVIVSLLIGIISGRFISAPIKTAVQKFMTTSAELSTTADQHERTAVHQAAAVNQTSATIDELGRSAHQSIFQADSANTTAQQAVANAMQGAKAMDDMLTSMVELSSRVDNIGTQILRLSEQTSQISHVTGAVKDIANQTNLLALNAAVEATRAGEHGKGFTVVSQEIRKLAEQSKKSAEKISDLVDMIQKGTNATVLATEAGTQTTKMSEEQVKHAKQSFDALSNSVTNIAEVLQQLSLTAKQQSNATNQIVDAIAMINTGANETANGISQSKIAIQNLNDAAEKLQAMV